MDATVAAVSNKALEAIQQWLKLSGDEAVEFTPELSVLSEKIAMYSLKAGMGDANATDALGWVLEQAALTFATIGKRLQNISRETFVAVMNGMALFGAAFVKSLVKV